MTTPSLPPAALRQAILADLRPVRPLRRPWVRALLLLPPAILLLLGQPLALGLRGDAPALGFGLLWGLSALQALAGVVLIGAALREAVPGRTLAGAGALMLALALAWTVAVTLLTWGASATVAPPGRVATFWKICFGGPVVLGLPVLAFALLLGARAFPLRPALVGGLAGMGAGLITDSGWRAFCHVSEPSHVLLAHVAAVATLALLGAFGARLWLGGEAPAA